MAIKDYKFTDPETLKLANDDGFTVAHVIASKAYNFTDPEILKLTADNGESVKDIMGRNYLDDE